MNMNCSAGVCSPTAKKAVLNVTDLTSMLANGDVKVTTGNGAIAITVSSPFSWASTHRLTLDAYQIVSFRAPVTVAGTGAVTITYNDGGTGGDLIFFEGAKLDFWDLRSSLIVGGKAFKLTGSVEQLADAIAIDPSSAFALANDYNAQPDGTYGVSPITTPFRGVFEGLGHAISNLSVNDKGTDRDVGMFATTYGTIRNFTLAGMIADATYLSVALGTLAGENGGVIAHVNVTGNIAFGGVQNIGGLVGSNTGQIRDSDTAVSGLVTSPRLAGSLFGGSRVILSNGGLVGSNSGSIENSSASGNVRGLKGATYGGGIVGYNYGTVMSCFASGTVSGYGTAGGLVGLNRYEIANSHASGDVSIANESGGLVGSNELYTSDSFASGKVSGKKNVGGLAGTNSGVIEVGYATGSATGATEANVGGLVGSNVGTIRDTYALGAASGGQSARTGGLVGLNAVNRKGRGLIEASYSTGSVVGGPSGFDGGAIGYDQNSGASSDIYWDLDTSNISDPSQGAGNTANDPGLLGLSDAQLKSGLPAGFGADTWRQKARLNQGYPYLAAIPPDRR